MAALLPAYPSGGDADVDLQPLLDAIANLEADILQEMQDRAEQDALFDERITMLVDRVALDEQGLAQEILDRQAADAALQLQINDVPNLIQSAIDTALGSCDFEQAFLDELNSP